MTRVRFDQGSFWPGFVLPRVPYGQGSFCPGSVLPGFVLPGFVLPRVCFVCAPWSLYSDAVQFLMQISGDFVSEIMRETSRLLGYFCRFSLRFIFRFYGKK